MNLSKELAPGDEEVPPPHWNPVATPLNYGYCAFPNTSQKLDHDLTRNRRYLQSRYVRVVHDPDGTVRTVNLHAPVTVDFYRIPSDVSTVPSAVPPGVPPLLSLDSRVQACVRQLQALFEARPIMVRRVQRNLSGVSSDEIIKLSWPYVGYVFSTGPFRDAIIRLGLDPRTDPKYRIYQAVGFRLPVDEDPVQNRRAWQKKQKKFKNSHVFDGADFSEEAKVWQVCDITDPMIKKVLDEAPLLEKFDVIPPFSSFRHNSLTIPLTR